MATQYAFGQIVTNGLILSLDAADNNSYPGSGTTWSDLSTGRNNGIFVSGAAYSNSNQGSIVFNGTGSFVSSSLSVNSISNVTVQCWANISTTSNRGAFVKVGGGSNGYSIGVGLNDFDNLGNEIIGLFPGIRWIDTNTTYGTGWKMATLVIGATSIPTIYVNASLIGSYSGLAPTTPTANVYVGRNVGDELVGTPRTFSGNIANVQIYNRVLSADEITKNYNAQKSRFGL